MTPQTQCDCGFGTYDANKEKRCKTCAGINKKAQLKALEIFYLRNNIRELLSISNEQALHVVHSILRGNKD